MSTRVILAVLAHRTVLRRRDRWSRPRLLEHQGRALASLRSHTYEGSPFYRRFHAGRYDSPLDELPVLTKEMLMEHFDDIVTDPRVHLADIETYLTSRIGHPTYLHRYVVAGTAGTTGRRVVFLWNFREWIQVITSYNRAFDWAGSTAGLMKRVKTAVVSSTDPSHQSARVGASINSRWVPTIRMDSGDPISGIVARLNKWQPAMLIGYASMLRLLAQEQLAGRLMISPGFIFSASEVLTDSTRIQAHHAWNRKVFNVYGATETSGIAAECTEHHGLHIFEDLVIVEVVDNNNQPVPHGTYGSKVLVTVLFSRTLPLIRYEMSDSVSFAQQQSCPCGRPFVLIEGIQGREQDALRFPGKDGGAVTVQPIVFHHVMDRLQVGGWQIVQGRGGLTVMLAGGADVDDGALVADLQERLQTQHIEIPDIRVEKVTAIERTAFGKAPLILSKLT